MKMANIPVGLDDVRRRLCELRNELSTGYAKEIMNMALSTLEGSPPMNDEFMVHGRWKYSLGSYSTPKCSCCGWCIPYSEDSVMDARNYCPNCGAKMDAKEDPQE